MNPPPNKDKSLPPMQVEAPTGLFWVLVAIGILVLIGGAILCLQK